MLLLDLDQHIWVQGLSDYASGPNHEGPWRVSHDGTTLRVVVIHDLPDVENHPPALSKARPEGLIDPQLARPDHHVVMVTMYA
jgi:hypothetical protein